MTTKPAKKRTLPRCDPTLDPFRCDLIRELFARVKLWARRHNRRLYGRLTKIHDLHEQLAVIRRVASPSAPYRVPDLIRSTIEANLAAQPGTYQPRPVEKPTPTQPGTLERIEALAARVLRGEQLWHPDDAEPSLN